MNKGLVKAYIKDSDRYYLLLIVIGLFIMLTIVDVLAYDAGIRAEQVRSESDRKQLMSIEESFADTKPFILFGAYRIWAAPVKGEWCYNIQKVKR